jgi:hypothetical protein
MYRRYEPRQEKQPRDRWSGADLLGQRAFLLIELGDLFNALTRAQTRRSITYPASPAGRCKSFFLHLPREQVSGPKGREIGEFRLLFTPTKVKMAFRAGATPELI